MGEIDGAFRAWGFAKNGTGGVTRGDRAARRARSGVEIRTSAAGAARSSCKGGRAAGVALENGDELQREGRAVGGRPEAQLPAVRRAQAFPGRIRAGRSRNFRVRGSSGKVNIALSRTAAVHVPARRRPAAPRRDLDQPEHRLHRARLRRSQVRAVLARTRTSTSIIPSMIDRDMAPPGHHVMSCFVQYAPYDIEGGWDDAKREAFGETVISTHRAIRAEHPPRDRRQAGDHAEGHRAHRRHHRRQHLPRRTAAASAVLPAPRAAMGRFPHAACRAITSAPPARIRAAASWARPASWRRTEVLKDWR